MSNHTYTVVGKGRFPIDMLRHDMAHPATEEDALALDETFTYGAPSRRHVITLNGPQLPTLARWESFGWRVLQ